MRADKDQQDVFSFRPFENLKEIIKTKEPDLTAKKAVIPEAPSDDELFTEAMLEVREIDKFRKLPVRRKISSAARKAPSPDQRALRTLRDIAEGREPINLYDTQEYVEWANPSMKAGQGKAIIEDLRAGRYSIQDFVDLHGFVLEEAEKEIGRFLDNAVKNCYRCVKIIHGRGLRSPNGPVLKSAVVQWLAGHYKKNVSAFVTARQCDGGLGALYVLLK